MTTTIDKNLFYPKLVGVDLENGTFKICLFADVLIGDKKQQVPSNEGARIFSLNEVHQAPLERQEIEEQVIFIKDQKRGMAKRIYKSKAEILADKKAELEAFIGGKDNDIYELVTAKWDKIVEGTHANTTT